MALYEERIFSRGFALLMLLAVVLLAWSTAAAYYSKAFWVMLTVSILLTLVFVDVIAIRIEIDEREVRIRGFLGLGVRKTVKIENIASFSVSEGWMSCSGAIHFTLPAKGCVVLRQKRGWTVSFTTNHPEEIARILAMLGVPREP